MMAALARSSSARTNAELLGPSGTGWGNRFSLTQRQPVVGEQPSSRQATAGRTNSITSWVCSAGPEVAALRQASAIGRADIVRSMSQSFVGQRECVAQ